MTSSFTCVDAFCGAGGLGLGLQDAGFDIRLSFDFDAKCIDTLKSNPKHIAHPVRHADINEMLGGNLLKTIGMKSGELTLLAGGPPCQGFSVQRIGSDEDDRNDLIFSYGELILEVRPLFFLMENVVGLGGKRGREHLAEFIRRMSTSGYLVQKEVLNAKDYGVPQRRKRLIVIGERSSDAFPKFSFPPKSKTRPPTVRDIIGHLPPPPEDSSDHPDFHGHRRDRLSELNKQRLRALIQGQGRQHLPDELLADCHLNSADKIGHRNVYGRMTWDEVAPTITARFDSFTRGKFGHPDQLRSISLYEGALLQTFPADYRFSGNKVDIARQIGNAVPPRLGSVLGKAILDTIMSTEVR